MWSYSYLDFSAPYKLYGNGRETLALAYTGGQYLIHSFRGTIYSSILEFFYSNNDFKWYMYLTVLKRGTILIGAWVQTPPLPSSPPSPITQLLFLHLLGRFCFCFVLCWLFLFMLVSVCPVPAWRRSLLQHKLLCTLCFVSAMFLLVYVSVDGLLGLINLHACHNQPAATAAYVLSRLSNVHEVQARVPCFDSSGY